MMFRIAPAVLAVFIAPSLASPVATDESPHRLLGVDYKAHIIVPVVDGLSFTKAMFHYGDENGNGGYGCDGGSGEACYCSTTATGALQMNGHGSSGYATGLDFTCSFTLGDNDCWIHVALGWYDLSNNKLTCQCNHGYEFQNCNDADVIGNENVSLNLDLKKIDEVTPKDRSVELVDELKNEVKLMVESA